MRLMRALVTYEQICYGKEMEENVTADSIIYFIL